jgi:hypothetical protein
MKKAGSDQKSENAVRLFAGASYAFHSLPALATLFARRFAAKLPFQPPEVRLTPPLQTATTQANQHESQPRCLCYDSQCRQETDFCQRSLSSPGQSRSPRIAPHQTYCSTARQRACAMRSTRTPRTDAADVDAALEVACPSRSSERCRENVLRDRQTSQRRQILPMLAVFTCMMHSSEDRVKSC